MIEGEASVDIVLIEIDKNQQDGHRRTQLTTGHTLFVVLRLVGNC